MRGRELTGISASALEQSTNCHIRHTEVKTHELVHVNWLHVLPEKNKHTSTCSEE